MHDDDPITPPAALGAALLVLLAALGFAAGLAATEHAPVYAPGGGL